MNREMSARSPVHPLNEELHVELLPQGVRVTPERFFPRCPRHVAMSVDELRLTRLLAAANELNITAQAAASAVGLLNDSDAWDLYPSADRDLWCSIIDLLVSMDVTWGILTPSMREIGGLIEHASDPNFHRFEHGASLARATFLLEAAEQYAVSVGHQMTNAALRVCIADPATLARLEASSQCKRKIDAVMSGSDSIEAWPFHSWSSIGAKQLRGSRRASARCMLAASGLYGSPPWVAMTAERGTWFHRVKPDYLLESSASLHLAATRFDTLLCALRAAALPLSRFVSAVRSSSPTVVVQGRSLPLLPVVEVVEFVDDH
jgi:hypothetical protein